MTAPLHDCVATNAVHVLILAAISDAADIDTSAEGGLVDPRLAFLARAHARFILVEAGEMSLDEALDGLVEPICDCQRWPLAAQWERTHPPVVRARTAERRR
jgi:hypothetical protein